MEPDGHHGVGCIRDWGSALCAERGWEFAHHKSGLPEEGIQYLLRTQADDGSWHVASRSIWLQPYFDSGFPYTHDQWISATGTTWAVMALALTVEAEASQPGTSSRVRFSFLVGQTFSLRGTPSSRSSHHRDGRPTCRCL